MKQLTFYSSMWPVPYKLDGASNFAHTDERIKELILNSSSNVSQEVSEMHLNINKFSAIDEKGHEHHIIDFSAKNSMQFKSMASGHYIKSTHLLSLEPGNYTTLRYYLSNEDNCLIKSNGEKLNANNIEFLDFEIKNGLEITQNEASTVKLLFDFAPFKFSRHFKPLTDWFKSKNMLTENWPKVVYNYLD